MNNLTITKITDVSQLDILQFNSLLDEDKVWDEEQARLFLSNPDNVLLVAFVDGKEVGFVTAYRLQRFDNLKAEVLIYEIGVDEAFRRRGIASALIAEIKKWAAYVGANEAWVLTEEDNEIAHSLYQKTGGVKDTPNSTMFTYRVKK
jgi:ribosomal protein S18 acetylase RimI-like enzyme